MYVIGAMPRRSMHRMTAIPAAALRAGGAVGDITVTDRGVHSGVNVVIHGGVGIVLIGTVGRIHRIIVIG